MRTPINVENFRRLAHELRADPDSYDQTLWIQRTECGTACCIGGRAQIMAYEDAGISKLRGESQDIGSRYWSWLGLPTSDHDDNSIDDWEPKFDLFVSDPVFYSHGRPIYGWPKEYADRWYEAVSGRSVECPAFVAADLLDAIADGRVEL